MEKAKREVKEYLSNKKIGRNTASLDICKIKYFRIIEKFYVIEDKEELKEKESDVKSAESTYNKLVSTS